MKPLISMFSILVCAVLVQAEAISLETYLEMVKAQNLDLKMEQSSVAGLKAKAASLAIPPPTFGFLQANEFDGKKTRGFEIMQTLPFPTKLFSDRAVKKYEYLGREAFQKSFYQQTLSQAKLLFYSAWENHQRESILQEKRILLQQHIKTARSTARSARDRVPRPTRDDHATRHRNARVCRGSIPSDPRSTRSSTSDSGA